MFPLETVFSMWAYRDPSWVGYDSVGANFYMEEPFGFRSGGDSCSAYYAAEIPDTFTTEVAKIIGEQARQLLLTGYYSNGQRAVDRVLAQWKKD